MIYHMMYMATQEKTTKQINGIFKDLLWGFDPKMGRRKTPLVAWSRLTQPRESDGLGFKDYMMHAKALLYKWVAWALDKDTEWA